MREFNIVKITPAVSSAAPATIEISGDFTSVFHGKQWVDSIGRSFNFYEKPDTTCTLRLPTTFEISNNDKYAGIYSVYTATSSSSLPSCEFKHGNTIIRVNEVLAVDATEEQKTTGKMLNIGTYLLELAGEDPILILENQRLSNRPLELLGRNASGWGEVFQQNLLCMIQNHASFSAPLRPFQGQLWFDLSSLLLMIFNGTTWMPVNSQAGKAYKHHQSADSIEWTIAHGLGVDAPFFVECTVFKNTTTGVKQEHSPYETLYIDSNTVQLTFNEPISGYAVVRSV